MNEQELEVKTKDILMTMLNALPKEDFKFLQDYAVEVNIRTGKVRMLSDEPYKDSVQYQDNKPKEISNQHFLLTPL